MYWTHHFAHHETLSRAMSWLTRLGMAPDRIEAHADGVPRLTVSVQPHELEAIRMLISAVERTDPDGWPSFWDVAAQQHTYPQPEADVPTSDPSQPSDTAIGWHPDDSRESLMASGEFFRKWGWDD